MKVKMSKLTIWSILIAIACLLIWASNYFLFTISVPIPWMAVRNIQEAGQLGDMFGISNSFFSAFTLLVVIYAALTQRAELHVAKEELETTKSILQDQTIALEKQNQSNRIAQFERTLFGLIDSLRALTNSIDLIHPDTKVRTSGIDALKVWQKRLNERLRPHALYPPIEFETFLREYEEHYKEAEWDLGHYFRTIYNVLRYIDQSGIENKKSEYCRILRASLSRAELEIIFFNCLTPRGIKLKLLIEKYGLLKHINTEKGSFVSLFLDQYDQGAYETRKVST